MREVVLVDRGGKRRKTGVFQAFRGRRKVHLAIIDIREDMCKAIEPLSKYSDDSENSFLCVT